ncbi:YfhO family protein [Bacillus sp. DX1.1]|uniref:YfhO family protein n=1 Tax=unclassified Bacillus (in: firmicutes) TaxID=185979 RepID=UPI002570579A|nr:MULTISPECIES: YfhO family protein [unclassified Bacillus (in: firmicutes)]MDM5157042.1 YfhO family protein [Bacillus sp. DX1.1]WJE81279.1 YfhO family protein [Bacillus sp. DX3.1]
MQQLLDLFKKKKFLYAVAFFLPFSIYGVILALLGVAPFGQKSILVTDLHSQYVQFYTYLYDVLKNGKSILYSWEGGMGLNFIGVFAYYLASPFSIIILLFDRAHIPEAIVLMTLLKVGLAGLTMTYYLSSMMKRRDVTIVLFSTFYALMSFVTVYSFCVMWLDGIYLLPLIMLGIERLLTSRKYGLFIFSLALTFISNFYISYMVGIFTFIYFVARYCVLYDVRNVKLLLQKFMWFCIGTGLAVSMSAFITLPTYMDLKSNFVERAKIPFSTAFNFDPVDFYSRFFNGIIDTTVNGMPNVYAGVLTVLLVPLFFITKKISLKEKIVYGAILLFLVLSFEIPFLNIAWHGFEPPTNFPYRYSFVFSFVLIYVAARTFYIFEEELLPTLKKVVFFNLFMIILLGKVAPSYMQSNKMMVNIFFVVVYALLLYAKVRVKKNKALVSFALIAVVSLDVALNTVYMVKLMGYEYGYINRQEYASPYPKYEETIQKVAEKDKGLYRMETTRGVTWNDALRFGYKGVTHFNSVANGHLNLYMQDLGYGYLEALILQNGKGIVSTDALLGMKYMISDQPLNKYGWSEIDRVGSNYVYENKNALPFGYMVNKNEFDTKGKDKLKVQKINYTNSFEEQNKFIGKLEGTDVDYYKPLEPSSLEYNNLTVVESEKTKKELAAEKKKMARTNQKPIELIKQQEGKTASIKYVFDVKGKQQLYTKLRVEPTDVTKVYVNGQSLGKKFTEYPRYYWNNGILDLGYFENEKVEVEIKVDRQSVEIEQQLFYGLDVELFDQRVNELKQQPFDVTNYTSRSVAGKIDVKENDFLFLSIPYDKGWKATVDGKDAKLLKLNDAFLGLELSKGTHTIELKYTSPGFIVGSIISVISFLATMMFGFIMRKKRK